MIKCVICYLCGKIIKLNEEFVSVEGQCGYHTEYHKTCLEKEAQKSSPLTKEDVEELGDWEHNDDYMYDEEDVIKEVE